VGRMTSLERPQMRVAAPVAVGAVLAVLVAACTQASRDTTRGAGGTGRSSTTSATVPTSTTAPSLVSESRTAHRCARTWLGPFGPDRRQSKRSVGAMTRLAGSAAASLVCLRLIAAPFGGPVGATPFRGPSPPAHGVASIGGWEKAEDVPGIEKLSGGRGGVVFSLSCAAAGSCAAGGSYESGSGIDQAFVVDETHGSWGRAEEVPGTAALNAGGGAFVFSLWCAAAGSCSAGGAYVDSSGRIQAFVVDETDGTWGKAEEVPGTATLNGDGFAQVTTLSCGSAGNCAAGGSYRDSSNDDEAFVVDETDGTWGKAEEVPGTATLNGDGLAYVDALSCGSAGNCAAGGTYFDRSAHTQAFVVAETDGLWRTAVEVPGTAELNTGGDAGAYAVSCVPSSCTAGGAYTGAGGHARPFVVDETGGTWGTADEVPHPAALNAGATVDALSCTSTGACGAAGTYVDGSGHFQAFVDDETAGSWGEAEEVPGTATLNSGKNAQLVAISCTSTGNCAAGGFYTDAAGHAQALVVDEMHGAWHKAQEVPGTATLNASGNAEMGSISCTSTGNCAAGGFYRDGSDDEQAFVVVGSLPPAPLPLAAELRQQRSIAGERYRLRSY
jgi:hypothetical protein